jgi:hypothetical protein
VSVYSADDPYNVKALARILARCVRGEHWHHGAPMGQTSYRGTTVTVRRIVWALSNGRAVPEGHNVAVTCGVPECIKPDHLAPVRR